MEVVQNKTNNDIYRCHRNIIWNHILWGGIFLFIMLYDLQKLYDSKRLILLADMFLVGRALFTVGYMVGTAIGYQSFRAAGFGLNIATLVAVASIVLKFPFLQYFA